MNLGERPSNAARMTGSRIRAARDALKLSQADLAKQLGFADRQTLSSIEIGERRVQPAELVRASEILKRPIDWFIDPFVVADEATFCWRVSPAVSDSELDAFEDRIGQMVGLLRFLKVALKGPSQAFAETLFTPSDPKDVSFERAQAWGELVANRVEAGFAPAQKLIELTEGQFGIPVLFIDAKVDSDARAISGAMCRLSDMGVIVVNRWESAWRRNFDIAHELFHALTWNAWKPERREASESGPDQKGAKRVPRIESLADNFAAGLLMPWNRLKSAIPTDRLKDATYLAGVARQFQVSTGALGYRLLNADMIDDETRLQLDAIGSSKAPGEPHKLFSAHFARLLHDGIDGGHVSARKAAKALSMSLDQLAQLMKDHGKAVPFEV